MFNPLPFFSYFLLHCPPLVIRKNGPQPGVYGHRGEGGRLRAGRAESQFHTPIVTDPIDGVCYWRFMCVPMRDWKQTHSVRFMAHTPISIDVHLTNGTCATHYNTVFMYEDGDTFYLNRRIAFVNVNIDINMFQSRKSDGIEFILISMLLLGKLLITSPIESPQFGMHLCLWIL